MNRKRSAILGALAIAAPLLTVVSAPAGAAPAQFCQENCYNSGYRYVLDQVITPRDLIDFAVSDEPLAYFCSGAPGAPRELIDSLDADQATASLNAASALLPVTPFGPGLPISFTPRILTDNRARPVGLGIDIDLPAVLVAALSIPFQGTIFAALILDVLGLEEFQLVCFDDRGSVSPAT